MDLDKLQGVDCADVAGRRVLLRADLNVPLRNGVVTDSTRLKRVLPGLKSLVDRGARVIVLSHFGRPNGQPNPDMSLRPVAKELSGLIGAAISFAPDCVGDAATKVVDDLHPGDVAVLENVRFHAGEETNDLAFAKSLAAHGDLYVNDAFSAAHRAHASTAGLAKLLPAFAGRLMMEEIGALRAALDSPTRPTAAIVGGAKISSKITVLTNLVDKVDHLIVGGGMANTFLLAQGGCVGASLAEPDQIGLANEIIVNARAKGCQILLPNDAVVAERLESGVPSEVVDVSSVPGDKMILDVGPKSITAMTSVLSSCRTVLWNGPLGAFETEPFGAGTFKLAQLAGSLTERGALTSIAGGGDTVAALNAAGVIDKFSYVSTAGGAFLEWIEGRELPGIVALTLDQDRSSLG
ncbi:MAG: phosphoglycerate kinase [Hyphomicrobiaceae bacterium]